eukprot:TRINITY_DN13017_c0_g2_i1.p1 TRINITY_DN13017_c0_g2~~TRINITY_DN13017_c0_g2_i1.p1  ORF type:complete len:574 (+),score=88.60 TRINITY_DN13017_c0_g2_i1:154-1875(+)
MSFPRKLGPVASWDFPVHHLPNRPHGHVPGVNIVGNDIVSADFFLIYLIFLLVAFLVWGAVTRLRVPYMSEAGVTLLVGFAGCGILEGLLQESMHAKIGFVRLDLELQNMILGFSSDVLFCVLLPPIIFHAGYTMRGSFFLVNTDLICSLAFVGTFVSSLVVGFALYWVQPLVGSQVLSLAETLTFGALISATDPVTTLAIFEQLNVDPHLFNVVFGESVLNDAVSIVLFHTFSERVLRQSDPSTEGSWEDILLSVANFAWIFAGSFLVGVVLACLSAVVFKYTYVREHTLRHGPKLELGVFLFFIYTPFLLAESLAMSGIVAVLFTGAFMKRYTYFNLSQATVPLVDTVVSCFAHIFETLIFIDLGTSAGRSFKDTTVGLILCTILICLVARALHVYPLCLLLRKRRTQVPRPQLRMADIHMIWFSGLRGAIAYALAVQFPGSHRDGIATLTMSVVISSILFLGGATTPMIQHLGVRMFSPEEIKEMSVEMESGVKNLTCVWLERRYIHPLLLVHPNDARASIFNSGALMEDDPGTPTSAGTGSSVIIELQPVAVAGETNEAVTVDLEVSQS